YFLRCRIPFIIDLRQMRALVPVGTSPQVLEFTQLELRERFLASFEPDFTGHTFAVQRRHKLIDRNRASRLRIFVRNPPLKIFADRYLFWCRRKIGRRPFQRVLIAVLVAYVRDCQRRRHKAPERSRAASLLNAALAFLTAFRVMMREQYTDAGQ